MLMGFITRAVFGLSVTEKNGVVRISGIRADEFISDIRKTFGTSKITTHMLTKATRSYVEFYSFFLIDIEYIVRRLAKEKHTRLGKRGYVKMQEALMRDTWLNDLTKSHPSIFNKSKLKEIKFDLLKHQSEFLDYYDRVIPKYNLRGMLMAATPGSGKTISSIGVACAFESKNVIVVAPKNSVFRVWEKTLLEDMNVEQSVWVHASKKPIPSPKDCRWYIFHYEALGDAVSLASKLSNERCTVILDESHNLNEMKSLRTERFVKMCKMMKNSLIVELSGTPMKAMGAEAIPLISAIDPLFTDNCVDKFKKIYGREAKAATEILANRLGIIMYKVNKEESKIDEPVEHTLKVKVPNAERFTLDTIKKDMTDFITKRTEYYAKNKKAFETMYYNGLKEFESNGLNKLSNPEQYTTYKAYIKEFAKNGYDPFTSAPKALFCNNFEKKIIQPSLSPKTKKDFKNAKSVVKYVNLKIRGECLGTVLSRARTNCNKAVLESLDLAALIDGAEKKTLVFTSYVEIVKAASDKLKSQGYSPLTVYAETNNNLPQMVKQFGKDESINPMIATYQSLSTAVPLIMANRVVLLNAPFRIHEKEQTVARANRIGQDKTVDVYNVLLDTGDVPNISTRSSDIMEWSREQVDAIMGFDNSDNAIAVEGYYQEEECLLDLYCVEDYQEEEEVDMPVIENEVTSLEPTFDSLINSLNSITEFTDKVHANLDNGITLSRESHEMFAIVSPPDTHLSLESCVSDVSITVASLEAQKSKAKGILDALVKLLKSVYDAFINYINDSGRLFTSNISASKDLKKYIASNPKAFSSVGGPVEVSSPTWLTRGGRVNSLTHLKDYKWEMTATRNAVSTLNTEFKNMARDFNNHLDAAASRPGLNQMDVLLKRLSSFDKLMIESSKITNDRSVEVRSSLHLGGKRFSVTYPTKGDEEHYVSNYSRFRVRVKTIPNPDMTNVTSVEPLNRNQAIEALDMIIENSKTMSYITSFIKDVNRDVKAFIKKAESIDKTTDNLDSRNAAILSAQAATMVNGLKGLATYTRHLVVVNDRASKASLNYVRSSAQGNTN